MIRCNYMPNRIAISATLSLLAACGSFARSESPSDEWPRDTILDGKQVVWLNDALLADGWIQLTGDAEHFGWQATGDSKWEFDESADVYTNRVDEPFAWLMSNTRWADFELIAFFQCETADANSGIFIRTPLEPNEPPTNCYEINIANQANPFPMGSIVARQKAKYSARLKTELTSNPTALHTLNIVAKGGQVTVRVDGELVAGYTDPKPIELGRIGLQYNTGKVLFKRVLIRPVGMQAIFNGKDLDGWNTDLAGPAKFAVTDAGELQVSGGSGQAESTGAYGNFVLQYECKVNGDGLNSGVFFRCIPGEKMNGYECQIQNQFEDGDRTKPVDCGTGGIYRRTTARFVNANDHEWFYVTLHAYGPHIAVWVNGIQVTDWTDTREPDPNPRRGLRAEPGTLCIQAHDPTTDLLFRNIRVVELPE